MKLVLFCYRIIEFIAATFSPHLSILVIFLSKLHQLQAGVKEGDLSPRLPSCHTLVCTYDKEIIKTCHTLIVRGALPTWRLVAD